MDNFKILGCPHRRGRQDDGFRTYMMGGVSNPLLYEFWRYAACVFYPFPRGAGNTWFCLDTVRRAPPTKRPVIPMILAGNRFEKGLNTNGGVKRDPPVMATTV